MLAAVGRGLSNAEIGAALFMSEATVKAHVSRLLTKLGARQPGAGGDPRPRRRPRPTDGSRRRSRAAALGSYDCAVASYEVNDEAVDHGAQLIDARQYVLDSDWGEVQPSADARTSSWKRTRGTSTPNGTSALTEGATDETKARYAFVYGDLRRVHRSGLIACVYRASEWRHKAVELAAHDLLQHLDKVSA